MSSLPASVLFDPREARVLRGLARWMSLLGRFQIVGAVFLFVVLLVVTGVVTTAEVIEPAMNAPGDAPLISIGEVKKGVLAAVVGGVVAFLLVFLRGGMLLISGAEDLEALSDEHTLDTTSLEEAVRRLRNYFILESLLMLALAAGVYALTIAGWGA